MTQEKLDETFLATLEAAAVDAARQAGALVAHRFGGVLDVSNKGKVDGADLVTDVDRASQRLIASLTVEKFSGHMLLGEEEPPKEEPPAADFVWAVDPIDGTTNFVNGLPIHAVSIGVLRRGRPVACAIWLPWPSNGGAGAVLHARSGGGAWSDDTAVLVPTGQQPVAKKLALSQPDGDGAPKTGRLSGIPGGLRWAYHVGRPLRKGVGEPRVSGSTAYETAMVATGVMQFSVSGSASRVWDYAASSLLVREAGGAAYVLDGRGGWLLFEGWTDGYDNTPATSKRLRGWSGPMIMGAPKTAAFLATNLRPRGRPVWKRVISRK